MTSPSRSSPTRSSPRRNYVYSPLLTSSPAHSPRKKIMVRPSRIAIALALVVMTILNLHASHRVFQDGNHEFNSNHIDMCFVSAQFGKSVNDTDLMMSPPMHTPELYKNAKFYVFTNLKDLKPAKGWTVIHRDYPQYSRSITQSRVPKFQGYLDHVLDWNCQVVFYFDASVDVLGTYKEFQAEAQRLLAPGSVGLVQPLHPAEDPEHPWKGGIVGEVERILDFYKDTPENANTSLAWFEQQPDYFPEIPVYQNTYFGYAVRSPSFRKVASFFWKHYSQEVGLWRDQPLWSYSIHHNKMKPFDFMVSHKKMFAANPSRQGMNGHTYAKGAPTKETPSEADARKYRLKADETPGRPEGVMEQSASSFRKKRSNTTKGVGVVKPLGAKRKKGNTTTIS